jgi:hypothetical protein
MDVEKTIEFILEQSAATAVQLQQLTVDIAELKEVTSQHSADLEAHTEWKLEMSEVLQDLAAQMQRGFDRVADKHAELTQKHAELAQKHAELADMQKITQENLNILVQTMRDMISRPPNQ